MFQFVVLIQAYRPCGINYPPCQFWNTSGSVFSSSKLSSYLLNKPCLGLVVAPIFPHMAILAEDPFHLFRECLSTIKRRSASLS